MSPENAKNLLNLSDEDLLRQFQTTQDISLLGLLYQRYLPNVYGVCLKYLEDRAAAQDAVMDIFELILDKLPHYEVLNFTSWLYVTAKNHCLQQINKEKRLAFVRIDDFFVENQESFDLVDEPKSRDELEALSYCITTLPEEQRKSIHYFYIENKSYADIVEMTGFALNLVKSYIQNGRRNLKNCMVKKLNILE